MSSSNQGPRRRRLRWGAPLTIVLGVALWLLAAGPPHTLVGLFDPGWEPGLPLAPGPALEIALPPETGPAELDELTRLLEVTFDGLALVRATDRPADQGGPLIRVLPTSAQTPRSAFEGVLEGRQRRFEILPILDESETAAAIRDFVREHPELGVAAARNPVEAEDEATLVTALEAMRDRCPACRPRAGETLAIEASAPWAAMVVTRREPVFDQRYLASARIAISEFDGRPRVLVTFTEAGRREFAALTRSSVGARVAIVIDGRVVSAPLVMQEILQGQAEIALGDLPQDRALREAQSLADSLMPPVRLPDGARWSWVDLPGAATAAIIIATASTLALTTLIGWLLGLGVERLERRLGIVAAFTSRVAPTAPLGPPPSPLTRVVVTLVALTSPWLLSQIPIPFLDLAFVEDAGTVDMTVFSLGALGLTPILVAHLAVAIIVWLVPPLAPLRDGSFLSRRRLLLPTGLLVVGLSALQAMAFLPLFTGLELIGPGLGSAIVVALSMAAGSLLLWGVAAAVTMAGLGHGLSVLIFAGAATLLLDDPGVLADGRTLGVLVITSAALVYTTGRRVVLGERSHRLPFAGFVPIELLVLIQLVLGFISLLTSDNLRSPQLGFWLSLLVFAVFTALIGWLVIRASIAGPRGSPGRADDQQVLVRGLGPSVAVVLLVVVGANAIAGLGPEVAAMNLGQLVGLLLVPIIAFDLAAELGASMKHGRLARVHSTHDVDEADRLVALLASRDVPAVTRAHRHRTLLRFMAPWLPVEVLVPSRDRLAALAFIREDAIGELAETFGPGEDSPTATHTA